MMNDLYMSYRSVHRPRPLWPEVGLYGGYNYIEIAEGLWLPRRYESYIQILSMNFPGEVKKSIKNSLDIDSAIFKPGILQQCDSAKLRILLNKIKVFSVQGYSLAAEQFLGMINYTKIYTDSEYHLPNTEVVSTEELCNRTMCTFTLMHYRSTNLKEYVQNWGNIIVYDANTFTEFPDSYLIGG